MVDRDFGLDGIKRCHQVAVSVWPDRAVAEMCCLPFGALSLRRAHFGSATSFLIGCFRFNLNPIVTLKLLSTLYMIFLLLHQD